MECEILVSVMNHRNKDKIINRLGISNDDKCLIINQIFDDKKPENDVKTGNHKFISYKEKGLSRSRNHALDNAVGDICVIADDDMVYMDDYKKTIIDAYKKYQDADIIIFIVDREHKDYKLKIKKEGRINILKTMKVSSVQITLKKFSILNKKLRFDEKFGAGSVYPWGEENIFLFDCIKRGCKIYYVPIKIATLLDINKTSWNKDNTPEHFEKQGVIYYRMSSRLWRLLALQFVLRKRKIYRRDMKGIDVYMAMINGVKKYKKDGQDD